MGCGKKWASEQEEEKKTKSFKKWIPRKEFKANDGATVIDDGMNTFVVEPSDPQAKINPKEAFGGNKVPMSCVPVPVMMEVGLAMMEGAIKYGRHNYRETPIKSSTYYDAANRHLKAWWEGQDIDPESGLPHIVKAIASLVVLQDSIMYGSIIEDRPPPYPDGWMENLNEKMIEMKERLKCYTDQNPIQSEPSNSSRVNMKA